MEQNDLDLLQTVPSHHLQALARARHLPHSFAQENEASPGPSLASGTAIASTAPALLELAQTLFEPTALHTTLEGLGEIDRAVLHELVTCGGRANSRDLAFYFSGSGLLAPARSGKIVEPTSLPSVEYMRSYPVNVGPQYPPAHPHGVFEQSLRRLLIQGLVFWSKQTNFAGREYTNGVHDGVLIVPIAVRRAVRNAWGLEPSQLAAPDLESKLADLPISEGARAFQRHLYLYWSLVASQREGLALLSQGLLARAPLRQIVEHMGLNTEQIRAENDSPFLLFLRLVLMELGLIQERRNVHSTNATSMTICAAPAERFFSLPLIERVRRCYQLYRDFPLWNELLTIPEILMRPGPSHLEAAHEEIIRARHAVIERIFYEQAGNWHDFATFVARTKLYVPYLLFPRQAGPRAERYVSSCNPYGWDFRLRRGWLTHREGWHIVEGGFIRAVVSGPLRWLGLVECEREEHPATFRLSSDVTLLASNIPVEEKTTWGRLIVQPNFELVALAPVSELLLINLDRFAERINLEHIAQYRLTKASVTRAIQMGVRAESIQEILEQAAGTEIPQNVRYSLGEWERQARRVEIWPQAILLEVDQPQMLDNLLADEKTCPYFGRRLSPTLIEVLPQHLEAIQELFWQRNTLPALSASPTYDGGTDQPHLATREPQWRLHDDGLLQPFYAVSDLFLAAELARFSTRDEATGWQRITPISLQQALADGRTLDYLIRFLQQYCEDGIPGSFLIRLKLWGGGYGKASDIEVEYAPLLRLSSQVLSDLRRDPELAPLLGSEVDNSARFIRVASHDLEQVITLLRERGFDTAK